MFEWHDKRQHLLSLLWIFITVNYIYCDVFTLHLAPYLEAFLAGQVGSISITEEFLLIFAFIMQIPMIMILLSRMLAFTLNKYANLLAGIITTSIQAFTVTMGGSLHYLFFSFFEICAGIFIIYLAATWKKNELASLKRNAE
ncbi:hypothetical protein C1E24_18475 [Pseudoalteromonas phenolica]|uniref:MFS transporter n=1 Tax=Pseudoalteromonas phenolica TaxID=161398 RepID=A0A5R9PXY5_9GAMM|nr:hypothetical protein C1E24_18475 [Pseudoalteromonas phenolica]